MDIQFIKKKLSTIQDEINESYHELDILESRLDDKEERIHELENIKEIYEFYLDSMKGV